MEENMSNKRRDLLKAGAGVAAAATFPMIGIKDAHAQWSSQPEKGAKLRVLRWSRFVQGDIDQYMKNVQAFTAKYGIEVRVDSESWEDVRPKAAVAANTGAGPDIILGTYDDANLYPEKLVDVTDLCNYLGKKYGGWYPTCELYLKPDGKRWIGVPLGATGSMIVYRESQVKAAGFSSFPKDTDGFLKMMKTLKDNGTPGGFALGHATGDANTWCHWLVWTFGGKMVDTNNNKVFLDGQISVTNNGISIYYASKNSKDPKINALQTDINHASYPAGPAGVSSACHLFMNQMIFKYTKYPKAAKEFIRFMMEEEQYGAWLQAGIGYTAGPLVAYEKNPIWTVDPKHTAYRDACKQLRPAGYAGKLGYASAGALADFIIVDMVAEAASGDKSPKEAMERAQKRAERYYKV